MDRAISSVVFSSSLLGTTLLTIRNKLSQYADTHIDQIILLNQSGKTTHEHICESLELFAREVMPHFRKG